MDAVVHFVGSHFSFNLASMNCKMHESAKGNLFLYNNAKAIKPAQPKKNLPHKNNENNFAQANLKN